LYGAGKGCKSMICLEVDSGIGAIAMLDGHVLRGAHGMAGEIGHSQSVPDGNVCSCGKRGCLETVASAKAIIARVCRERRAGRPSSLPKTIDRRPASEAMGLIGTAAEKGDPLANDILEEAGRHLGNAVAALVNFFDPQLVVMAGMVAYQGGSKLLDVVRKTAAEHVLPDESRSVQIERGSLGDNAALIGAAASVCEKAFRVPLELQP
jgi:predicted NBD/HSP70 family sugar kinase